MKAEVHSASLIHRTLCVQVFLSFLSDAAGDRRVRVVLLYRKKANEKFIFLENLHFSPQTILVERDHNWPLEKLT